MNNNIGDSTIVLTAKQYTEDQIYLFKEQIERIREKAKSISENITEIQKNKMETKLNNTLAIIGERGSGKSSVMGTVRNILIEDGYFAFEIIDPSVFDDSLSILEILLSGILDELKKMNKEYENYRIDKVYRKAKQMMATLSYLRLSKDDLTLRTDSDEFIVNINSRINFDHSMKELILG